MAVYGPFKIVLGGEGATGKTSLLNTAQHGIFTENYKVTIGCDFAILDVDIGEKDQMKLTCWDSGGQSRFACIRQAYYKGMSGFLILFDITKRASFERVLEWYYELRAAAPNAPFILIGNKVDMAQYREVSSDEALALAMELGAEYYLETSAKTDIETMTPFQLLSKCIALREVPILQQTILA